MYGNRSVRTFSDKRENLIPKLIKNSTKNIIFCGMDKYTNREFLRALSGSLY